MILGSAGLRGQHPQIIDIAIHRLIANLTFLHYFIYLHVLFVSSSSYYNRVQPQAHPGRMAVLPWEPIGDGGQAAGGPIARLEGTVLRSNISRHKSHSTSSPWL